jgi:predicted phage terminase large subunit-like protein
MAASPANMYADLLRHDLCAFIHRSFLELNPQNPFHSGWHIEVIAAKLDEVRRGRCKRLIVNMPPRHLKSHAVSIAFPAWVLGHEPSKKILSVTYGQDLSDNLARESRKLMMSDFYQGLFDTRLSKGREAVSDYETTAGGYRLSTSVRGALTGRGADLIIIDDPLKADDALSESLRRSVNEWCDNTLRSRLNSLETGAIIIVMQRLHADDLVAHVQEQERWDVLSFPAIAEQDESYTISTSYGRKRIERKERDILHPALLSPATLEAQRRAMTDYNFTAQYQQNPQPPSGIIVKREWLRFYGPNEKPERFDQIIQSWDTANKDTELANFSVCTTWGIKDQHAYLLDVYRHKLDFPELKRAVRKLAKLHQATIVLVEDKASGTSLIQELRAENFSIIQAAPEPDGGKIMRLSSQTAKIAGGFALFPKEAHWLNSYLLELVSFPNSKNDDQVDSTVFALAWMTANPEPAIIRFVKEEIERRDAAANSLTAAGTVVMRPPKMQYVSNYQAADGEMFNAKADGTFVVRERDVNPLIAQGWERIQG